MQQMKPQQYTSVHREAVDDDYYNSGDEGVEERNEHRIQTNTTGVKLVTDHVDNAFHFLLPNLSDEKYSDEEVATKVIGAHFYMMFLYGAFAITIGILFSRIPNLGKHSVFNSWFSQVNARGELFQEVFDVRHHFFSTGFPPIVFAILIPGIMFVYHCYAGIYKPAYSTYCCRQSENHWKWVAQGLADSFWGLLLASYFGQRDLAFMLLLAAAICGCAAAAYGFEKQICIAMNRVDSKVTGRPIVYDPHVQIFGQVLLVLFLLIFTTFMAQIFLNQDFVPQWLFVLGVFTCFWKLLGVVAFVKCYWDIKRGQVCYNRLFSQGEWNFAVLNFLTYGAQLSVILAYTTRYGNVPPIV